MHSCIIAFFFTSFCEPHLVLRIAEEIILSYYHHAVL